METINLGAGDGLPPVQWATIAEKTRCPCVTAVGAAWFRVPHHPRSATVVLGTEPGGLTGFRF